MGVAWATPTDRTSSSNTGVIRRMPRTLPPAQARAFVTLWRDRYAIAQSARGEPPPASCALRPAAPQPRITAGRMRCLTGRSALQHRQVAHGALVGAGG